MNFNGCESLISLPWRDKTHFLLFPQNLMRHILEASSFRIGLAVRAGSTWQLFLRQLRVSDSLFRAQFIVFWLRGNVAKSGGAGAVNHPQTRPLQISIYRRRRFGRAHRATWRSANSAPGTRAGLDYETLLSIENTWRMNFFKNLNLQFTPQKL